MTTVIMDGFVAALRSDPQLARGLAAAVANKPEADAAGAVARYARQHGFNVTEADAARLLRGREDDRGALTDDQLDAVAGGWGGLGWTFQ